VRILYLGGGRFYDAQCAALVRNGHVVTQIDPNDPWSGNWLTWRWVYETGGLGLCAMAEKRVLRAMGNGAFDLIWVGGGQLVGLGLLRKLRRRAPIIVNYNPDNPYVGRDRRLWVTFRRAIEEYDLLVTCRRSSVTAAYALGARRVMRAFLAADEPSTRAASEIAKSWSAKRTDVVFVGTWMPGRGAFLSELLDRGVPLRIFGQRWWRAPEYRRIRNAIAENDVWGFGYAEVIARSKIAIGLLSEGNEDLHTTRSVEIPAIGTLLCAKRTSEHCELYDDGAEAIFWDDAEECARRCLDLLKDESRIAEIAQAGRRRALANNHFNQEMVERVLTEAIEGAS
jgi:hypothetical protein